MGRQEPDAGLRSPGRGQDIIDHLERDQPGQLAQMAWRERPCGYRHRSGYGNLISQRSSRCQGSLRVTTLYTGAPLLCVSNTP